MGASAQAPGPAKQLRGAQAVAAAAVNDGASIPCPPGAPGRDLPGILKRQEERDAVWNYGSNGKKSWDASVSTRCDIHVVQMVPRSRCPGLSPGSGWTSRLGHRLCSNFGAQCQVSDFRGPVLTFCTQRGDPCGWAAGYRYPPCNEHQLGERRHMVKRQENILYSLII